MVNCRLGRQAAYAMCAFKLRRIVLYSPWWVYGFDDRWQRSWRRMMAMGGNGCYVQLVRACCTCISIESCDHACEAIHGTQTRAPFSPLHKSHTLKKARIKEGLFIGPPTCPLLSNREYFPVTALGLLSTLGGGCLLFDATRPFRVDRALQHKRTKHAENLGSSDLATCNRINDFHSPACSARRRHSVSVTIRG
jgi:hypothetical protein